MMKYSTIFKINLQNIGPPINYRVATVLKISSALDLSNK
jgi:hypothetical protein